MELFQALMFLAQRTGNSFLPQILGELVDHGGDEALHGAELGVQPQEHQHEEEAAAPERGEGHLQHGAGVGQEGETRPWADSRWILGRYLVDTPQITEYQIDT